MIFNMTDISKAIPFWTGKCWVHPVSQVFSVESVIAFLSGQLKPLRFEMWRRCSKEVIDCCLFVCLYYKTCLKSACHF